MAADNRHPPMTGFRGQRMNSKADYMTTTMTAFMMNNRWMEDLAHSRQCWRNWRFTSEISGTVEWTVTRLLPCLDEDFQRRTLNPDKEDFNARRDDRLYQGLHRPAGGCDRHEPCAGSTRRPRNGESIFFDRMTTGTGPTSRMESTHWYAKCTRYIPAIPRHFFSFSPSNS